MYRIHQLKLDLNHSDNDILVKASKFLGVKTSDIASLSIFKRSIDARDKSNLFYVYAFDVELNINLKKKFKPNEVSIVANTEYKLPKLGLDYKELKNRPIVIGFGPAGIYAMYILAKAGLNPICFERGLDVDSRQADIDNFLETGKLNPESNVLFGEGGAGTFSDGKLNTLIKDRDGKGRFVLKTFVEFGAPENIMYDSKPHIGTDKLREVIKAMREEIIRLGGEIKFGHKLKAIEYDDNALKKLIIIDDNNKELDIETEICILATGHSARDVFSMLEEQKVNLEAKDFAIGVRVLHKQELINTNQYGEKGKNLPAAAYKLTHRAENGRGVYSFCMCPGGYVVNSSSEEGGLVVNGMSNMARDGEYANSAIIVTVTKEDYEAEGYTGALAGVEFQRKYEKKAFYECSGKIPVQYFGDFKENRISSEPIEVKSGIKGMHNNGNIRNCLPGYVSESLISGISAFDSKIHGFGDEKVVLCGIESRTSSPVRIIRDESLQANISGLFPCGEGAGYAGGIMSAALDGIKVSEYIVRNYKKCY